MTLASWSQFAYSVTMQQGNRVSNTRRQSRLHPQQWLLSNAAPDNPAVDVIIEIPRGSFLKRGSQGQLDFVSPLPCPFNYGSVPDYIGLEGDLLDALVLGPRLPSGSEVRVTAWGAVSLIDRGLMDDKLVCGLAPPREQGRRWILNFFHLYARCKGLLNLVRGQPGANYCGGWCDARDALARAVPRVHRTGSIRPRVNF